MLQFPGKGNEPILGECLQITPQIAGKQFCRALRRFRIHPAQTLDRPQRVEEKVGADLAEHDIHLQLLVLRNLCIIPPGLIA